MLEDRKKGVVYVAINRELFDNQIGWSEPVEYKFEKPHVDADPELIFRRLDAGDPSTDKVTTKPASPSSSAAP